MTRKEFLKYAALVTAGMSLSDKLRITASLEAASLAPHGRTLIKQHKTIALLPQIKPKFKIKPNQLLTKQHLKIKPQLLTIKQNQKTTLKIQRKQQPLTTLIIIQIQLKEQSQKLSLRSQTALLVKSMIAFKNNA